MLPTSSLDAPYPSVPAPESSPPGPPPPVGTPALLPEFRRGSRSNPRRRSRREGGKKQRQRRRLALLRSRPVLPVGRRVMALSPAPYRLPTSFPVTPSISLPPYLSPTSSRGIPWAMLQALDISPASSLDTPPAISPAPDFSPPAPDFSPAPDYLPPPPPPSPPLDFSPPPPSPQAQSATPVAASHSPESSLNTSSRPTDSDFSSRSSPSSTTGIVGSVVGGVVALVILSIVFICLRRRMKRHTGTSEGQQKNWLQSVLSPAQHVIKILPAVYASRPADSPPGPPPIPVTAGGRGSSGPEDPVLFSPSPGAASLGFSKNTFTYEELVVATDGFTDANLLGQGGFGYVHRGTLPNGKEVAVKQLKAGSGQGEREFQAEVEIISRVHHKHLVSLVGYCITGEKRLLVYEFVPNNTLEFHLHGKGQPVLEWSTRMKIALGSAKGLAYLHEDCHPKIIHRDIKASNILLDAKFEAKVADFGLAKITAEVDTHVSTRVMGTFGYLAPEYAASGKLTDRSDVFSFGVMLLELITGRQLADPTNAFMEEYLVDWARPLLTRALEDGNYEALVDPRLQKNYDVSEMTRLVACAAACVRHVGWRRPGMNQIVRFLQGDVSQEDLNKGVTPSRSPAYGSSTEHERKQYNEDMRKFIKLALGSQDYPTSEYSAPTSQHGLTQSGSSSEVKSTSRETESGSTKKDSRSFSGGS